MAHLQLLHNAPDLTEKLRRVFTTPRDERGASDPELSIYAGFASDADKRQFGEVRRTPAAELGKCDFGFRDPRYAELLFRYRARNWPQTLTQDEHARWEEFCQARLTQSTPITHLTLDQYFAEIVAARANPATTGAQQALLDQLDAWGHEIATEFTSEPVAS